VLVICPGEVVRPVYAYLRERFPNVEMAGGSPPELTLLEAYRLLSRDAHSRLGWRIALELDAPPDLDEIVVRVLNEELEFADNLPYGFSEHHLPHAETVSRLVAGSRGLARRTGRPRTSGGDEH
jgi:hypothetical protein